MMNNIKYRLSNENDITKIKILLEENKLPILDLDTTAIIFLVAVQGEKIIGCVGVEKYGNDGLMRSFAVDHEYQNKGVGSKLYECLIEKIKAVQVETLHLLTTTAEKYFHQKGFRKSKREFAPVAIKQTREFSDLCPLNSVYMTLKL